MSERDTSLSLSMGREKESGFQGDEDGTTRDEGGKKAEGLTPPLGRRKEKRRRAKWTTKGTVVRPMTYQETNRCTIFRSQV